MSKFKVGDRVRILSDAIVSTTHKTVAEYFNIKSAVGLIATIGKLSATVSNRFLIYDLPLECYGSGDLCWSYRENQLELVDNTAKQDFLAQHTKAIGDAYWESADSRHLSKDGKLFQFIKEAQESTHQDMVNNPAHYTAFPIELKNWNFAVMQTIKDPIYCAYFKTMSEYLHRAHLKNGLEDIKKLLFWGNELVKHVEDGKVEIK